MPPNTATPTAAMALRRVTARAWFLTARSEELSAVMVSFLNVIDDDNDWFVVVSSDNRPVLRN